MPVLERQLCSEFEVWGGSVSALEVFLQVHCMGGAQSSQHTQLLDWAATGDTQRLRSLLERLNVNTQDEVSQPWPAFWERCELIWPEVSHWAAETVTKEADHP